MNNMEVYQSVIAPAADQAVEDLIRQLGLGTSASMGASFTAGQGQRSAENTPLYDAFLASLDLNMAGPPNDPVMTNDVQSKEMEAANLFQSMGDQDAVIKAAIDAAFSPGLTAPSPALSSQTLSSPEISTPMTMNSLAGSTSSSRSSSPSYMGKNARSREEMLAEEFRRQEAQQKRHFTGTRNTQIPLLPENAPIASRKYLLPSSTSRKRTASDAGHQASIQTKVSKSEGTELSPEEIEAIEAKRRQNTVAARRSRLRKQQHLQHLEDENKSLKERIEQLEAQVASLLQGRMQ